MRHGLIAVAAAFLLALVGAGSATPARGVLGQRLLVFREGDFAGGTVLMDERGRAVASLEILTGLNGGVAVDRTGTKLAYVQAANLELPPGIPARFRRRFPHLPEATLQVGTFLRDVQAGSSGSFAISWGGRGAIETTPGRPAWSPSGRSIVVASPRHGQVHLVVIASTRPTPRQLTDGTGRDVNPAWSPDGGRIVFERHLRGEADLYSVRPDGSDVRRVTYLRGRAEWPDFSPDGHSLVFSSDLSGRFQLYVLRQGETTPTLLTHDFGNDRRPSWSPDGHWIAFTSDRDGDDDVFLISPDGTHERKLTHNATEDLVQDWQPLRDVVAPRVRALPSTSRRGRIGFLRYTVSDGSRLVLVGGAAELRVTDAKEFDSEGIVDAAISPRVVGPGRHVIRFPVDEFREYELARDESTPVPSRFRFCLDAVDAWGNVGPQSCAQFRFR